ncbi:lipopolysaccharide core heptose(II) kinase RfaY [Shimwellia blattae]|uniref:Lipopolysaccharide core biosynthesis protein n=1 Tax=Shimwellia blattae (strain ATCC 29907 / DSM 4481 / JCM 1650 / NBRC 105725 / CDC 9005-74) TaxID=630626 RepID=I2BEH4_SHIBC|nr:lipopolysaccharide core heptose(II) kinase RfaY [Shimwellia blattae]AFJ48928.1 lipopolysaccharide core biosynthesis protein [Shimwellia blattae DSM 4481 = NBRC 105725]GAB81800.1 lipopolysaccharide core heptose(II) kinase [Shimwellia blattae DSM 4481 = NBRC 105725]VDY66413.1 Lipopolysaccharide core heptose(II) kinase rfaY [Shimwellia blattae]VEC28150.1 Lipopolysaccharide core heptose(II) kinase rfaY [Shimwellia blattae]
MSIKHNVNGYAVFTKSSDGEKYIDVLNDFFACNIKVIKVFRNIEDTKVLLIDTKYGKLVLKIFSPKLKKTERFLKAMLKGDYYEKLFQQTERIRNEGLDSVNDFYLLAERKTLRFVHTYIMLIEYIEGTELSDIKNIDEKLKEKIKRSIDELHQHGMVSGDPHKGNFIIQDGDVRIIDLSGKRPSAARRAKDRIDLERHYDIVNEVKDFGYYLLIYKKKFRNFIRKLKGKEAR